MNSANANLQYSKQDLEQLTEAFEGIRLVPYQDQNGIWTNGYGNTHGVVPGVSITQAQAEADLLNNIQWAVRVVKGYVNVVLNQFKFDALVDFVFNVGAGNFQKSTLLKCVNANDQKGADAAFMMWDKVAGQVNKGLARRRLSEQELFDHVVDKEAA